MKKILAEQNIKQKEFADILGVTPNYINILANNKGNKKSNISKPLAELIQLKFGYSSHWILTGEGDRFAMQDRARQTTINKIRRMNREEINAVLAFINSIEDVKRIYGIAAPEK